jgi:hypothetical protein
MLRRLGAVVIVLAVLATACSEDERGAFEGFRDLQSGSVVAYRVGITQTRTTSGLGSTKKLRSSVRLDVEEEVVDESSYALVVRDAKANGEPTQRLAATRLAGRRLAVDLDDGRIGGDEQAFGGTDDIAAGDIGMLFTLFAPVLSSSGADVGDRWRVATQPVSVPWSLAPLALTFTHEVIGREEFADLDALRVKSVALGNVRFRLPIVAPASSSGGGGSDELVVGRLFDALFADIDNPVAGVAAAIAAIPLAVAAPFLALGEALGSLFGGSGEAEEPKTPVVDLSGPFELRSDTRLWDADGRVLDALGNGTMSLRGRIPELPGGAAELSGRMLEMEIVWKLHRAHTSAFPADRDPPGRGPLPVFAVLGLVLAAGLAAAREAASRLGRRRSTDATDTLVRA